MPPEDRATKTVDRCELHPGAATVATCDGCGRALCITCAVPVRGEVFGNECLPPDLDPAGTALDSSAPLMPRPVMAAGVCWILALVATVLPWTRFGTGSGAFGAWARDARWSMAAVAALTLGLLAWRAGRRRGPSGWRVGAQIAFGAAASASSVIAWWNPPPFTKPAPAPLIAATFAALAAAIALVARTNAMRASI